MRHALCYAEYDLKSGYCDRKHNLLPPVCNFSILRLSLLFGHQAAEIISGGGFYDVVAFVINVYSLFPAHISIHVHAYQ